jgi:peroxiredoxin
MDRTMENQSKLQTGQAAPDFTLPDINGKNIALKDFRGQVVIVNFWSAECTWAERADEALLALLRTWGEQVVMLAVASNAHEDVELVRNTASQRQLPYLLIDEKARVADLFGAQTTPHLFLVDRQGILRYQGAFDDITFRQRTATKDYLRQAVEAVLAGAEPDPGETPAYGCTIVRLD